MNEKKLTNFVELRIFQLFIIFNMEKKQSTNHMRFFKHTCQLHNRMFLTILTFNNFITGLSQI